MADDSAVNDRSSSLPDSVSQWLSDIADEQNLTEEELLTRFLSAMEDGDSLGGADESIEALETEITATREEFQEKIEDVRDRVIQVKREADQKAPANHSHQAFTQLKRQLDEFEGDIAELDHQVNDGFENFEEILEYLTETTESLDKKITTLARAVMNLRQQVQSLSERHDRDLVLQRILDTGNRERVKRAECQSCEQKIDLALLSSPVCPNCQELFSDLEVNKGFFNSSVLKTESVPALEGESTNDSLDLTEIVSDEPKDDTEEGVPADEEAVFSEDTPSEENSFSDGWIPADGATSDDESSGHNANSE